MVEWVKVTGDCSECIGPRPEWLAVEGLLDGKKYILRTPYLPYTLSGAVPGIYYK